MTMIYDAASWYWLLSGDTGNVFSAARAATVPQSDATYLAWLAAGNLPARIGFSDGLSKAQSYADLYGVLVVQAPSVAAAVRAAWAAAGYLTAAQLAEPALAAGLTVNSTGNPAINGTFSLDATTQMKIAAVEIYILKNGAFPGGVSTLPWATMTGAFVEFPSPAVFSDWATAIADYVAALGLIIATGSGTLPPSTTTIA